MKKNNARLVAVAVTTLIGMTAWAGAKSYSPVGISIYSNGSGGQAWGSLGSTRNTTDTVQYIGCHSHSWSGGSNVPQIICFAFTASSVYGSCVSSDPSIVAAVQSLKGDSEIQFEWNASSQCTYVRVSNVSWYAPKNP